MLPNATWNIIRDLLKSIYELIKSARQQTIAWANVGPGICRYMYMTS